MTTPDCTTPLRDLANDDSEEARRELRRRVMHGRTDDEALAFINGPAQAPSATTPRAPGECHACYHYGYASLAAQPDGRWLCRECEAEAAHVAAGGTIVNVPCPTCADPRRTFRLTRQRCPACNGAGTVRRMVPAPAPVPECPACGRDLTSDGDDGYECYGCGGTWADWENWSQDMAAVNARREYVRNGGRATGQTLPVTDSYPNQGHCFATAQRIARERQAVAS